jgi:hypothetical protein
MARSEYRSRLEYMPEAQGWEADDPARDNVERSLRQVEDRLVRDGDFKTLAAINGAAAGVNEMLSNPPIELGRTFDDEKRNDIVLAARAIAASDLAFRKGDGRDPGDLHTGASQLLSNAVGDLPDAEVAFKELRFCAKINYRSFDFLRGWIS